MSPDTDKKIQFRVGLFTLTGLLIIAALVTYLGRIGEGLKTFYPLTVEYPNASGLLKGADVLMAGAKVGKVGSGPHILPDAKGVAVGLKIYTGVEIPANSVFTIGSSGLLGDRFVDITMLPNGDGIVLEPGTVVQGKREMGMGDLANEGARMLEEVRETVAKINTAVSRINDDLLTRETLSGIGQSVANLRQTTETLSETAGKFDEALKETSSTVTSTAKKLDVLVDDAGGVVTEAGKTMTAATGAAKEIAAAASDARKLIGEARTGKGALAMLLSDRAFAEQLNALVVNLRRHGILFYKDRARFPAKPD